jgi:hypothetical protein
VAPPTSAEILRRASETLNTARAGLNDLREDPERRLAGLSNTVVFGRAVTNVLENLRSIEPTFDSWYQQVSRDLADDPLMKFFYSLRSQILKRGDMGVAPYVHIKAFSSADLPKFGPPPANARGFFMGDQLGGVGWEVETSPGVTERYYVDLPADIGTAGLYFRDAPVGVSSSERHSADIVPLCERYLDRMQSVLNDARARFGSGV